ncbi:cytochrome b [Rhizobium oryzicola]|uniref:Cytochrome b/b6 domain-containing protein n=1 Tax=Rhizobium oryzicola TaxID=1232668 RepID=A0ABT8T086_9HYPH|nr:cytochrome b/b6 domain-containing protein [Rhizobium oryzicola]MDO1584036.1 cytochrome b/b6 domain-containing protein [Rhizobium oryzicola]
MAPLSYSVPQRILHWGMALLIFFNLIFSDGIEHWKRLVRRGQPITPDDISSANIHAYVGIAILVLAVVRLVLRHVQGVPQAPAEEPAILSLVAKITHGLLYLLLILMPLTGIGAYYFANGTAGDIHADVLKVVLWALLVAHVAGALVHQFYWKTDVLARMTYGVKKPASP